MHQIELSLVFLGALREDKDVINMHPYEILLVVSENIIDNMLEHG